MADSRTGAVNVSDKYFYAGNTFIYWIIMKLTRTIKIILKGFRRQIEETPTNDGAI